MHRDDSLANESQYLVSTRTQTRHKKNILLYWDQGKAGTVNSDQYTHKPRAPLMINRKLESYQIDSGATVNVLSSCTLVGRFCQPRKLEKTNITLVMYNKLFFYRVTSQRRTKSYHRRVSSSVPRPRNFDRNSASGD